MVATLAGSSRSTTTGKALSPSSAQSVFELVAGAVDQRHLGAGVEHRLGAGEADAGGRAGDGGDLAVEFVCHGSSFQARPCDTRLWRARLSTMTAMASTPPVIM